MGFVHRGRESRRRGCGFCCLWRHGLNVQASSHDGLVLDSEGCKRSPVWGICRTRARPSAAHAFAIPGESQAVPAIPDPGRLSIGAVEGGEGWLCQDAGVVEFAAAMGPADGAIAARPWCGEVLARDRGDAAGEAADGRPRVRQHALERVEAAGEVEQRAGEVVFVVGRVDGGAWLRAERVKGEIVEDQAARQG